VEFILLGLSTLSVCFTIFTFIELQSVKEELESLNWKYAFQTPDKSEPISEETPKESEIPTDLSDSAEVLTDAEIARIEREDAFDKRIAQIKEELALRGDPMTRRGTEAPILHPHVHNLPHTAIPEFSDELPDVEITY
jgi:hypothetical protein